MSCNVLQAEASPTSPGPKSLTRTESVEQLARRIRLIVFDVDGVLTDGGLYYDETGLIIKRFDVHDGIGIRLAMEAGIEIAVISGMNVPCVERRLEILGVTEYHGGHDNKATVLDEIRMKRQLQWAEIAYLGDDWVDLAPMLKVGLPVAVANAMPEVKEVARLILQKSGGSGAARELTDYILTCQGKRDAMLERWKQLA